MIGGEAGYSSKCPWAEALIGLLLFAGLRTRAALISGSLLMLLLTFGTALRPDWQTIYLQLTYAFVYAALLAGRQSNLYSIDAVAERHRSAIDSAV